MLNSGGSASKHLTSFLVQNDSSCTCTGHTVTYQCSIVGGGTTVWQGSAFQCSGLNRYILLRHSNFNATEKPYGECNNGAITARAIGVHDSCFRSQLTVSLSPGMNNKTVECVYDNGTENMIGSAILSFRTGS